MNMPLELFFVVSSPFGIHYPSMHVVSDLNYGGFVIGETTMITTNNPISKLFFKSFKKMNGNHRL